MTDDHAFGPLVVFGLGGAATEVLADHAADIPADRYRRGSADPFGPGCPLLLGLYGNPVADLHRLRELLQRIARSLTTCRKVTEPDLNSVIAKPHGILAVDARIKVTPRQPHDAFFAGCACGVPKRA